MKIGVISDTHIPGKFEQVPGAIIEAFKNVDMIVHAGDLVGLEVIGQLEAACPEVFAVAGNMDYEPVRKKYPVKQILNIEGFKLGIMHGWGAPVNLVDLLKDAFKEDNCDIIIFGHTHRPMNERIGSALFFNPGSATDEAAPYNSYGIIEIRPQGHGLASGSQGRITANIIKI